MRFSIFLLGLTTLGLQFALRDSVEAAEKFVVSSTADAPDAKPGDGVCAAASAKCTLRAAIDEANAGSRAAQIVLQPGRYEVDRPLKATAPVSVRGAQPNDTIVAASASFQGERVFVFDSAGAADWRELSDVTLDGGGRAGGIATMRGVPLRIVRSVVRGGQAREGGAGVSANGPLILLQSSLVGNRLERGGGRGGALLVEEAPAWITQSTLTGNFGRNSGGIFARNASVVLHYSSLVGNTGGPVGGYQQNPKSSLEIRGSWIGETRPAGGSRRIDCRSSAREEGAIASGGDNLLAVTGPTSDKLVNGSWQASYEFFCALGGPNDRTGSAEAPLEGAWRVVTGPTGLIGVEAAENHPASRMVRPDRCPSADAWGRQIPQGLNCDAGALYAGEWTGPVQATEPPAPRAAVRPAPEEEPSPARDASAPVWVWVAGFGVAAVIAVLLLRRRGAGRERE